MNPRPHFTKPDKNQRQIIDELEKRGYIVWNISSLPGLADLIVFGKKKARYDSMYPIITWCGVGVEVKVDNAPLTEKEQMIQDTMGEFVIVARSSVEDVMPAVKTITAWFGRE